MSSLDGECGPRSDGRGLGLCSSDRNDASLDGLLDANADGGLGPDEYADLAAARGEVPAMVEGAWRAFSADVRAFFADLQQRGMQASKFASSVLANKT